MTAITPRPAHPAKAHQAQHGKQAEITGALMERARCDEATALSRLGARFEGLTEVEVAERVLTFGPNQIARSKRRSKPLLLFDNVKNPLIILLLVLSLVSYLTGDLRAAVVVLVMAILDHEELEERLKAKEKYRKIGEIPFDFVRRRMSVSWQAGRMRFTPGSVAKPPAPVSAKSRRARVWREPWLA